MNGFSCAITLVRSNPAHIMTQTDKSSFVEKTTDIIPVLLFPCYISKGKTKAFAQLFVHQEADICFLMQTQEFHIHKIYSYFILNYFYTKSLQHKIQKVIEIKITIYNIIYKSENC